MSGLDNKDFEKLAVPLLDGLYNFACWLSGDTDEARDLVQETFVKSLKGFSSFREGTNFRAWMFRILRNTFLTSRTGLERRNTEQEDEAGLDDAVVSHGHAGAWRLYGALTSNLSVKAFIACNPAFRRCCCWRTWRK